MFRLCQIRRNAARAAGHTLMELMVVMALLAIAASLLLPITVKAYSGLKLRFAADSIVRLMQQAKSRALFESRTYLVIFSDPSARDREILLAREDGTSLNHYNLPSGISLTSQIKDGAWSAEISPLAFYPDGTSEGAQLSLKNASRFAYGIELDPMTAKAKIVDASQVQP